LILHTSQNQSKPSNKSLYSNGGSELNQIAHEQYSHHDISTVPKAEHPVDPKKREVLLKLLQQRAARQAGEEVRSHVSVSRVKGTGIVHVRIKGNADTFEQVGIKGLNTDNGPKRLHYLRVPTDGFQGRVVGGDDIYYDKSKTACGKESQQSLVSSTAPGAQSHAYINGGYFNLNQAWQNEDGTPKDRHIPIGETATSGDNNVDSIPVPEEYRQDYKPVSFGDGSKLTSGPELSEKGEEKFKQERLEIPSINTSATTWATREFSSMLSTRTQEVA
jgi:hypothetical protein